MAELQWYCEPGEDKEFIAKTTHPESGFTRYWRVRPIESGWICSEFQNDEFDNGRSIGVYPTMEAAKAAAEELKNRPPGDPSVLLDVVEWAKEAGEDEIAERYQAKYDAFFEGGTSQ